MSSEKLNDALDELQGLVKGNDWRSALVGLIGAQVLVQREQVNQLERIADALENHLPRLVNALEAIDVNTRNRQWLGGPR